MNPRLFKLNLYAPYGLVEVSAPAEENDIRADVTKSVSFICVPSFKVAQNLQMPTPERVPMVRTRSCEAFVHQSGLWWGVLLHCGSSQYGFR